MRVEMLGSEGMEEKRDIDVKMIWAMKGMVMKKVRIESEMKIDFDDINE